MMVGEYKLDELLVDTTEYQDRVAVHTGNELLRRRARIYLVPDQTSAERRLSCKRKAHREVGLLLTIGHRNILTPHDFHESAPLGPTLMFDEFEGGLPLDDYLGKRV